MSWIAEYDTQGREFPTCVHVTKTTGTMTHGATYVPIEDGKAVRAENDKLRKQVAEACEQLGGAWVRCAELRELASVLAHCAADSGCDSCPINGGCARVGKLDLCETVHDHMRELGIEV